jgi:hypothetical protein
MAEEILFLLRRALWRRWGTAVGLSQKLGGVRMVQDAVTGLDDSDRIMASAVAERYAIEKVERGRLR